jgi:ligand-binding sensor domain-containing protein
MFQDQSGHVWWGTGQGLYNFDKTRFYQVKRNGPWQN